MIKPATKSAVVICILLIACTVHAVDASDPVLNPQNGHYYQAVPVSNGITWHYAATVAQGTIYAGKIGHLATITSADELAFIEQQFPNISRCWLGGFRVLESTGPSDGWCWITGEEWNYTYWAAAQPDNTNGRENWLLYGTQGWTDEWAAPAPGYIVEYDEWTPKPVLNPANGHYYLAVVVPEALDWYDANERADAMVFEKKKGHLATVTSADENSFIVRNFPICHWYWLGGFQPPDSLEPTGNWQWVTGEPWIYANWDTGEPNNTSGVEDGLNIYATNGHWNDLNRFTVHTTRSVGYVVEFEPQFTIGSAKTWSNGTSVFIKEAVVTANQTLEPGSIFVESADRSSGIRLITDEDVIIGDRLTFTGVIDRVDGERQMNTIEIIRKQAGSPLDPMHVNSRSVGNDPTQTLNYCGIDTTGLLLQLHGTVTADVASDRIVYIDDGGNYCDGVGPVDASSTGIRVYVPEGVDLGNIRGSKVVIRGISRVEKFDLTDWVQVNGNWMAPGTVVYVPSIWVRHPADFRIQ